MKKRHKKSETSVKKTQNCKKSDKLVKIKVTNYCKKDTNLWKKGDKKWQTSDKKWQTSEKNWQISEKGDKKW